MFHRIESYESNVSGVSASSSEIAAVQLDKERFEAATTIEELQELTIGFLQGELQATSYHFAPLLAESGPLVNQLVALNRAGFITTSSQPGGNEAFMGRRIQKRAFVEGILKRRYLAQFLQEMYVRLGYNCFIRTLDGEMTYEEIQDLEKADLYWVTRYAGEPKGLLHITEVSGPCQMFQTCDEIYPLLVEEYVSVFVMDTRWGAPASMLFGTLLEVLASLEARSKQSVLMNKSQ